MAVIREHLATKGLGLHCDLQNEHAIVGNNVGLLLMLEHGSVSNATSGSTAWPRARGASPSASPSRPMAAMQRTWRRPPCAMATIGSSTGENLEHRHSRRLARSHLRPHER